MNTATSDWPQDYLNWCGIANIQAIEWYDWLKTGSQSLPDPTQTEIRNLLDSGSDLEPWGTVPTVNYSASAKGPYVLADISADSGTDPRAIAYGAWTVTPNNFYFHNYIYRTSNLTATYNFGSDFGPHSGVNDPISVTINSGAHSFIVSGVYATSDPSAGGETIDGIDAWDPSVGEYQSQGYQASREYVWSTYDWLNYVTPNNNTMYARPYSTSGEDPDPSTTASRYYDPPFSNYGQSSHWNGYFITIEQDYVTVCNGSPDYALDEYGHFAAYNGSNACG